MNPSHLSPMEPEIVVQDLPNSPEREHAAPEVSTTERRNLMDVIEEEKDTPFVRAEHHLYYVLSKLEGFYKAACETSAVEVTMELTTFTNIATKIQNAWEEIQAAQHAYEESLILKSVKAHPGKYRRPRTQVRRHASQAYAE